MKTKMLAVPVPVRAVMPMGGWTSCLPPVRARPPVKPVAAVAPSVNVSVCVAGTVVDTNYGGYDAEYFDEQFGEGDDTSALDNLSDKELRFLTPIVEALKMHDWTYEYSDDAVVWRHGNKERTRINALLASIPTDQARALWKMYAPSVLGPWRLS